jgi:hypothetical protein
MWRTIPRRYIEGHVRPPSSHIIVGHGADKAVELDLTSKIKYRKLLGPRDVEAIAVEEVDRGYRSFEPEHLASWGPSRSHARLQQWPA